MGRKIGTPPVDARTLRVPEAIERYRLGKTKLYALIKSGKLRSTKVEGTRLIHVADLEALIAGISTPEARA